MAKRLGKRKMYLECRVFNPQWTHDYFFVQCKEKAVCRLVAVFYLGLCTAQQKLSFCEPREGCLVTIDFINRPTVIYFLTFSVKNIS